MAGVAPSVIVIWLVLHVIFSVITAAFAPLFGNAAQCQADNIPAWACHGPFAAFMQAVPVNGINGVGDIAALVLGAMSTMFSLFVMDYPILQLGDGIMGLVSFMIRLTGGLFVLIMFTTLLTSIIRR